MYLVSQYTVDIVNKFTRLSYKYSKFSDRDKLTFLRLETNAHDFYGDPDLEKDCFWRDAEKLISNRRAQKKRIKKYLKGMFLSYDQLFFLTLTYRDDSLYRSSESSKRQAVTRFLNSVSRDYIGNSDVGKTNHRLHFHAVVALNTDIDITSVAANWRSVYGNLNFKKIKVSNLASDKLARYLSKLTNHAGKLGTSRSFHKRSDHGYKEVDNIDWLLEYEKIS